MAASSTIVRRFIEDAGNATQTLGLGRSIGQIYAYLYFSPAPRALADIQKALGISKGGASMAVRQLEQWGAARQVWVKGDRKDYYEANDWFGKIARKLIADVIGARLSNLAATVEAAEADLPRANGDGEVEFIRARLLHLRAFQGKIAKVWANPIMRRLVR